MQFAHAFCGHMQACGGHFLEWSVPHLRGIERQPPLEIRHFAQKSVLVLGKIPKTTGNTAQKFGNARLVFPEADRCNGSLFGL